MSLLACGAPAPGSEEDLRAQIEAIDLPASMVERDHTYVESCPAPCPSFVVWYAVIGPLEEMRVELVEAMTAAGWDVREASASLGVYTARSEDHIMFAIVNPQMIARNPDVPPGTKAEIVVKLVDAAENPS